MPKFLKKGEKQMSTEDASHESKLFYLWMENTEMWNKRPRDNDPTKHKTSYKEHAAVSNKGL
jgi:hypothetical protein